MKFAKIITIILFFVVVVFAAFSSPARADYSNYRTCTNDESCVIGEFLFDDDSTPISTASCTLTSKYPDGSAYVTSAPMSASADGWYERIATTSGQPTGLYRSQMCCTVNSDLLCIDKSFIIASSSAALSPTQISEAVWNASRSAYTTPGSFGENLQNPSSVSAADIWNYPTRSLTSFGSLVSDIWSYSTRTISDFGNMVASIWGYSDRTITSNQLANGTSLATQNTVNTIDSKVSNIENKVSNIENTISDANTEINSITSTVNEVSTDLNSTTATLNTIKNTTQNTNNLLEQVINEPVIKTYVEDGPDEQAQPVSLSAKIEQSKQIATKLAKNTSELKQQLSNLSLNWTSQTAPQTLAFVSTFSQVLGVNTEDKNNTATLISQAEWLAKSWDTELIQQLKGRIDSTLANSSSAARELQAFGKSSASQQYLSLAKTDIDRLEKMIGNEKDSETADTLFGFLLKIEQYSNLLEKYNDDADELLKQTAYSKPSDMKRSIADLETKVLDINLLPTVRSLITDKVVTNAHPHANEENALIAIKTVIEANQLYLSQAAESPIKNIWIENGSVIFKAMATNPSKVISQKVPIKYYLPSELSEEDILELDPVLSLSFDSQENALLVSGEVELAPTESKTFAIKTQDIWKIDDQEIEAIRKQTQTLFEPLQKTSYFAQGATLKADIEVSLDKAELLLKENHTPELRIKAYRQARIEVKAAQDKLENLKTLVSSAGSVGTIYGFVGGVQTVAVWGLIIILVAGFVFLALYMQVISKAKNKSGSTSLNKKTEPTQHTDHVTAKEVDKMINAESKKIVKEAKSIHEVTPQKNLLNSILHNHLVINKILLGFVFVLLVAVISLVIYILQPEAELVSALPTNLSVDQAFSFGNRP